MRLFALWIACALAPAPPQRTVIEASAVFDGRGRVLRNTRIVIEGAKIVALDPKPGPADYRLRGTILPGWIDAHVHITSSFGEDGKFAGGDATTPEQGLRSAANAWATLLGGVTTAQSMGAPSEAALRDAIATGSLPGPRLLTALTPLTGRGAETGTLDEIRAHIRKQKQAGADLVKIYAFGSLRQGAPTLSQEQLDAACDEARRQGLRTLVHAYGQAVRTATLAGCTQVEHGVGASDDDLRLMAERGTYLDPQAGALLENYRLNRDRYVGAPFFPATLDGFEAIQQAVAPHREFLRRAARIPGLKIVFGDDALAGMHGHNAEELVQRVREAGVDPMAALVSANWLAAQALGMSDQIGSIAPGLQADIIGLDGDPLRDIAAVRRVVFVMKGGIVYKN
jgi:imidazolonepropionase-like amidohydrolase